MKAATGAQVADMLVHGTKPWPTDGIEVTNVYTHNTQPLYQFQFTFRKRQGRKRYGLSSKDVEALKWWQAELAIRDELLTSIPVREGGRPCTPSLRG